MIQIRPVWVLLSLTSILNEANCQSPAPVAKNVCRLPSATIDGDLSVGFTAPNEYTTSVGTLKGAMVFVDFEDTPANDTTIAL